MTKEELLADIQTWPDGELFFVLRGSNLATPEAIREYARRVLHINRMSGLSVPSGTTKTQGAKLQRERDDEARKNADAAFQLADRMQQLAPEWIAEAETLVGLRADAKNAELEKKREEEEALRAQASAAQVPVDEEKARTALEDESKRVALEHSK